MQRHALVADILQQSKAGKVVDLGCGEGKLLEHFIRSPDCTTAHTLVRHAPNTPWPEHQLTVLFVDLFPIAESLLASTSCCSNSHNAVYNTQLSLEVATQ